MNEDFDALTDKLLELSMKLKAAENKLKEARVEHLRELSKFSHNLKNPVGVISSFAEMLHESSTIDEAKRTKFIEVIQVSSKLSLALVNSFQEYNKLQYADIPVEYQDVEYVKCIKNALKNFESIAAKRNQIIDFSFACDTAILVKLDEHLISKIITQVLDNASRFSQENTVISVEIFDTESSIITKISDSGIGVPENDISFLTNPFYTVNTYDVYQEKCIGLGLTKAKIILNELGGEIAISSEPEKGTAVEIRLKKD